MIFIPLLLTGGIAAASMLFGRRGKRRAATPRGAGAMRALAGKRFAEAFADVVLEGFNSPDDEILEEAWDETPTAAWVIRLYSTPKTKTGFTAVFAEVDSDGGGGWGSSPMPSRAAGAMMIREFADLHGATFESDTESPKQFVDRAFENMLAQAGRDYRYFNDPSTKLWEHRASAEYRAVNEGVAYKLAIYRVKRDGAAYPFVVIFAGVRPGRSQARALPFDTEFGAYNEFDDLLVQWNQ